MSIKFVLEKREDPSTGIPVDTLLKQTVDADGKVSNEEPWGSVIDFDKLFNTCVKKWGSNWDLDKVCTAINEADFN